MLRRPSRRRRRWRAEDRKAESSSYRHHPWRIAVVIGAVVVLGGFGFVALRYVFREHPGPKSVNSAVNAFRGEGSVSIAPGPGYQTPAAGVYELNGKGAERISFPPNSQNDGTVMPATVRHLATGCWRWHVDYNVAHWEEYDFCSSDGQLLLEANRNSQSWDFGTVKISNLARFTCPPSTTVLPRGPLPAQTLSWSCTGTNTAVAGQTISTTAARIVATDLLRIGRTVIPAVHQRQQMTLSGGQGGTATEDWWFETKSGLPLRMERHITITSSSPVGAVTYNEDGFWQMTSLQPRT